MAKEFKLGIFVLSGLVALFVSIFFIRDIRLERGYNVHILFYDTGGLVEKSWVRSAGVKIGRTTGIKLLSDGRARVDVWIWGDTKIYADTKATIVATGLLGVKYLALSNGTASAPLLKNNDTIIGTEPVPLDKLAAAGMSSLNDLVKSLSKVAGDGKLTDNIGAIIENARQISDRLAQVVSEDKLDTIVENLTLASAEIARLTKDAELVINRTVSLIDQNKDQVKTTLTTLQSVSSNINDTITNLKKDLDGDSSLLGKVLHDKKLVDDIDKTVTAIKDTSQEAKAVFSRLGLINIYWDYQLRVAPAYGLFLSDIGLRIWPRPDRFYFLAGENVSENTTVSRPNSFTGLLGRQFGPLTVYGGIIRSTGGFGLRWRPFINHHNTLLSRWELQTDMFDFSRQNPIARPYWSMGTRVGLTRWFYLGMQVEDTLIKPDIYTYGNLVFQDEDIAYLFGLVGLASPFR